MLHRIADVAARLAIALVTVVLAGSATAQPRLSGDQQVLFTADSVRYERDDARVVAEGNVEISYGPRLMTADRVIYDRDSKIMTASGNVTVVDPSGDVYFAEAVTMTEDLAEGVLERLRVRLADNAAFAAASGTRTGGEKLTLERAVYSACEPCADNPQAAPLWQLKSNRIVHDSVDHEIEYFGATLEMFGVPVAWSPYFVHPDATVKQKSGFLAPSYGSDSQLGAMIRLPYYFAIAPDRDATFAPIITTEEGIVLAGEYRQRFTNGRLAFSGSITEGSGIDGGTDTRGHIRGDARFDLNDTWRAGLDLYRASDDTYLRRYDFDSRDSLTSRGFIEGFRGRNYATAQAYAFQSLRSDSLTGQNPLVAPLALYSFVGEPGPHGGRWSFDASALSLTRTRGTDTRRLALAGGWQIPYTSARGELYTAHASVLTEGYWANDLGSPGTDTVNASDSTEFRAFSQVGLDWRLPFVRFDRSARQMITPIAGLILAPNVGERRTIPNEDSQTFDLDETNVFSANRFPGIDRIEGGSRAYYGVEFGTYGWGGGNATLFLGQSYSFSESDQFGARTGLEDQISDVVGRLALAPHPWLDLIYAFRVDEKEVSFRRNEVITSFGPERLRFDVDYLFLAREQGSPYDEREELTFRLVSRLSRLWWVSGETQRDLTDSGGTLRHRLALRYADECFIFDASFTRDFTNDRDIKPGDRIFFRLIFKTLGELQTGF